MKKGFSIANRLEISKTKIIASSGISFFILIAYLLIVYGSSLVLVNIIPVNHPLLVGLLIILISFLLLPLRNNLHSKIEKIIYSRSDVFDTTLAKLTKDISQTNDLIEIVNRFRNIVQQTYQPVQFHVFIFDPKREIYSALDSPQEQKTTDITFGLDSPILSVLSRKKTAIPLSANETLPSQLMTERTKLTILDINIVIPFQSINKPSGWVGIRLPDLSPVERKHQINEIEILCECVSTAIERAQVIVYLELRIQEMDVLTRIAQGISFTPNFDDILELIYAQTSHVIKCSDFYILLNDPEKEHFIPLLYIQNDERIHQLENIPVSPSLGLERQIFKAGQPIVTNDYPQECFLRGVKPLDNKLSTWLGVPIIATEDIMGVLSLGSRNSSIIYTNQNLQLLQAIANLTAGAIVRTQLGKLTEERANQLASLHEIGKNLTSTLEINRLTELLIESAVRLLNSTRGVLYLYQKTDDHFLPVATYGLEEINTQYLTSPGDQIYVLDTVSNHQPLIINHKPEIDTEEKFENKIYVPLHMKNQVIGVIEVSSKKENAVYDQEDSNLLVTFASQAAIAIDNAMRYTQTDEALRARLEEISVMQEIDRELNASLDVERSLKITLDRAMQQTKAQAGLVGFFSGETIQAKIIMGYANNTPRDIAYTVQNDQTEYYLNQPIRYQKPFFLENGAAHVFIPIIRDDKIIATLIIESSDPSFCDSDTMKFLSRLSDHAAIALANAQLYSQIQQANLAKTEFISLVSHELKTPMTSIKGYTDLIAQGAAGPVNDLQANFLHTIRLNVGRMANLVSDLSDISRIESGRLHLEFGKIDLTDALEEVIRSIQSQVEEKKQKLILNISDYLPSVWADRNRLIQILNNLVSNAQKYSPVQSTLAVNIQKSPNIWDEQGAPEVLHVQVIDQGVGINPEDQVKIFQKFFRSEDPMVRENPGTGLGLNITRSLVEMQGGKIWFISEIGKGSNFQFTIPVIGE